MFFTIFKIFIFGWIGCQIFNYLHIPGGTITGSLVMLAVITSQGYHWSALPPFIMTFLQIVIGVTIGCKFNREQLPDIKSYFGLSLFSSLWMILVSLAVGYLLTAFAGVDLGTALYGSVPVGLVEMGLLALTLNLDVPVVTLLQFVRYLSINISVPLIVARCSASSDNNDKDNIGAGRCISKEKSAEKGVGKEIKLDFDFFKSRIKFQWDWHYAWQVIWLLFLGSIGGFTAKYFGVPVGGMLGSMVFIGILRIAGLPLTELPRWLIRITQITIGGYLGTSFLPETLSVLKELLIPVLVFSFIVVLNGVILGYIFYKFLKWDLATALLANSAGGPTLMVLNAIEMNADIVKVSVIQTLRATIILLIMPALIMRIIS